MWYLKLDDENLMALLQVMTNEYLDGKKIPLNDENIENLRSHLTNKLYKLITDRSLYVASPIAVNEYSLIDEVIDNFLKQ